MMNENMDTTVKQSINDFNMRLGKQLKLKLKDTYLKTRNTWNYAAYYLSSMYLNLYELYTHPHTHFSTQAQVLEKHTHTHTLTQIIYRIAFKTTRYKIIMLKLK